MINKTIKLAIDECGGQAKLAKLCGVAWRSLQFLLGFIVAVLVANTSRLSPKHLTEKSPKQLNVECENNHLSFIEALDLIEITNSTRTVAAIADKIDHLIVPMPKCASCCADVVQGFLDITTNAGKIGEQIKSAVHPNSDLGRELSNKEKQTISASIDALIESALCLKWELEQ